MVATAETQAKTSAAVGSSLNALGSIGSVLSLGPGLFMLIHLQTILSCLVLIGSHVNEYVVKVLQTSLNPFDL